MPLAGEGKFRKTLSFCGTPDCTVRFPLGCLTRNRLELLEAVVYQRFLTCYISTIRRGMLSWASPSQTGPWFSSYRGPIRELFTPAYMPATKDKRKELWDYFRDQGIELTQEQHDHIRSFVIEYANLKTEVLGRAIKQMQEANERRRESNRQRALRKKRRSEGVKK